MLALPQGAEQIQRRVAGYSDTELELIVSFLRAGRESADQEISRMRREGLPHAVRRPAIPQILHTHLEHVPQTNHSMQSPSRCFGLPWFQLEVGSC